MDSDPNTSTVTLTNLGKLAGALALAQAEIKAPIKNRHVDFQPKSGGRVKYSYADLADVIEAVRLPLSKNGLSIIHQLVLSKDGYGLTTSLLHSSGEKIDTWYPLPDPSKQQIRAQEFGSALTYARRYSLSSLIGIASEEDDDGASAAPTPGPQSHHPSNSNAEPEAYKRARLQREENERLARSKPVDDLDRALQGDPMPDYETGSKPMTLIDQLLVLMDENDIPNEQMPSIIKLATGTQKKGKELSDAELRTVINYINLKKKRGNESE